MNQNQTVQLGKTLVALTLARGVPVLFAWRGAEDPLEGTGNQPPATHRTINKYIGTH